LTPGDNTVGTLQHSAFDAVTVTLGDLLQKTRLMKIMFGVLLAGEVGGHLVMLIAVAMQGV
jgi:hypothetical protein